MTETVDHTKRALRLKKIFRPQPTPILTSGSHRKNAGSSQIPISSPILQHSTSIYSLVSPVRADFDDYALDELLAQYHQPTKISVEKPFQRLRTPEDPNSLSPAPRSSSSEEDIPVTPARGRKMKTSSHSQKAPAECYDLSHDKAHKKSKNPARPSLRRHSCSSTDILRQQYSQQLVPPMTAPLRTSSKPNLALEIPADNSYRTETSRPSASSAAAAAAALPSSPTAGFSSSKSTPLRKIKTYNVHAKSKKAVNPDKPKTVQDVEQERRRQILEDLISGRRGSTLKFTLTPEGLT
ncbi:hypothetical protein CLU79DRAFT_743883 [Phycomyces nitens]|nr:hypothetical protein CLU79DRAFT_743883 [Phycomyces nitens]